MNGKLGLIAALISAPGIAIYFNLSTVDAFIVGALCGLIGGIYDASAQSKTE